MSQYINAIIYSLYNWDKDYGTGGNLGWDYYRIMAFGGLVYAKKDADGKYIIVSNGNKIYKKK